MQPTPGHLFDTLCTLRHPHHALEMGEEEAGKPTIRLHQWPSWLQQGAATTIRRFWELFSPDTGHSSDHPPVIVHTPTQGSCAFCGGGVSEGWWHHVFYSCTSLSSVCDSAQWRAFTALVSQGHQGLAMYACFPLFVSVLDRLVQGFIPTT